MTGSGRHPDDDDALWQQVTRGVTPYERPTTKLIGSGNSDLLRKKPKKAIKTPPARIVASAVQDAPTVPRPIDVVAGEHAGLDRMSRRRLVQGQMEIGARLDLHGMTAARAEHSLARFIETAAAAHHRCVLVITGKGREGRGVLRQLVPLWLKTPPLSARILAISKAKQSDGGDGALYVMLRRSRKKP